MQLIDFLIHLLQDPLTTLQNFLSQYHLFTYAVIALIVFVETGLIIMPLLPGDSLLFAVGLLASSTGQLDIKIIIPLLISAALLGDNVNHLMGKHFSSFVKSRKQILFFKQEYLTQTEAFYEKHGGKTVIIARFIPIVRTIAPFVAGAGSMKYSRYILYCIIGATLWVTSISLTGYLLGSNEWVKHHFEKIVLAIVFVSFLPIVWQFVKVKWLKQTPSI